MDTLRLRRTTDEGEAIIGGAAPRHGVHRWARTAARGPYADSTIFSQWSCLLLKMS